MDDDDDDDDDEVIWKEDLAASCSVFYSMT